MTSSTTTTSSSSSTGARQALLHTISERERELGQIRDAAEKIIKEEQRTSEEQLQHLHSQLMEQQKIIQDKDESIQRLCSQIQTLEHDYRDHQQLVAQRSKEEVERQIEKIQSRLEKEYLFSSKDNESRERKRLQMEFEEKLASCERKFQSEFQASVLFELKKQEETLWSNFDKVMKEKQSKHEKVEKELHDIIRKKEKDILDVVQQYESQYDFTQTKLLSDLQMEKDRYGKITHDLNESNKSLRIEKENVDDMYKCTRDKLSRVEEEAAYAKDQVQQLLDVLHNAEENYIQRVDEFKFAQSGKDDEIYSLSSQIEKLKVLLKQAKASHRQDLKQAKKIFNAEKKCLEGKITDLRAS